MKAWFAFISLAVMSLVAQAQGFPGGKPVAIVVPFAAGGPVDRLARDLAEALRKPLGGATVVIENVAGAGGTIAANKVAKGSPDGYSVLLHHVGMATSPALYRKLTRPALLKPPTGAVFSWGDQTPQTISLSARWQRCIMSIKGPALCLSEMGSLCGECSARLGEAC